MFSLRPNPDILKMPKRLLINTDVGFQIFENCLFQLFAPIVQPETLDLRKAIFLEKNGFCYFRQNPDSAKGATNLDASRHSNSFLKLLASLLQRSPSTVFRCTSAYQRLMQCDIFSIVFLREI